MRELNNIFWVAYFKQGEYVKGLMVCNEVSYSCLVLKAWLIVAMSSIHQ